MRCAISCTFVQKKLSQQKSNYPKQLVINIFISPVHALIFTNDSYFFLLMSTSLLKKKQKPVLKYYVTLSQSFSLYLFCVNLLPYMLTIFSNSKFLYIFSLSTLSNKYCLSVFMLLKGNITDGIAYKQQTSISHKYRGWKIQDQGVSMTMVW